MSASSATASSVRREAPARHDGKEDRPLRNAATRLPSRSQHLHSGGPLTDDLSISPSPKRKGSPRGLPFSLRDDSVTEPLASCALAPPACALALASRLSTTYPFPSPS